MSEHSETPWYANGHAVYMGADGGFSLRCCPSPEENAKFIVTAVNYHHRLRGMLGEIITDSEAFGCPTVDTLNEIERLLVELSGMENQK